MPQYDAESLVVRQQETEALEYPKTKAENECLKIKLALKSYWKLYWFFDEAN